MLLSKNLHSLLEEKLQKLNKFRPISSILLQKLKERFEIEMTYNSNAIEGNSLTLKETFWVISQGITVKGKPLQDHLEAKNHKEALDFLYDLVSQEHSFVFTESLIRQLNHLIIQDINRNMAGQYRNADVFITGTEHIPPSSLDVPTKMKELIDWIQTHQKQMNVVEFASIIHHKFVHIHPFADGNGRTGRLLMNVFLMRHGFPIAIIQKNDRQKYYRCLRAADAQNYKPLVKLVAQAVLRSLNIYLDTLTPTKQKELFIPLSDVAKFTPYSQEYLSKLAKEGRIDAHKHNRNWVTTKEAIERYIAGRHRKK